MKTSTVIGVLCLSALTACSSAVKRPILASFEQLTNEVSGKRGEYLNYTSLASITGLGKVQGAGLIYYHPGKKTADSYASALVLTNPLSLNQNIR